MRWGRNEPARLVRLIVIHAHLVRGGGSMLKKLALALLLMGLCVSVGQAGVPRVIAMENYGATW